MSSKNNFGRAIDLSKADAFINGAKTNIVAEQDRAGRDPGPTPVVASVAPVTSVQAPAPAQVVKSISMEDIDRFAEAEIPQQTPPLLRMEHAAVARPINVPKPAPAPAKPPEIDVVLRPDGTPTDERVLRQVNFKMTEPNFWRVKDFVDSTPRLTMQKFLEDAAVEKMQRMMTEKKR